MYLIFHFRVVFAGLVFQKGGAPAIFSSPASFRQCCHGYVKGFLVVMVKTSLYPDILSGVYACWENKATGGLVPVSYLKASC